MKKMLHYLEQKKGIVLLFLLLLLMAGATSFEWRYFTSITRTGELEEGNNRQEYLRHYVMISDDSSSALWDAIFRQASTIGKEKNVLVEMMGNWFSDDYTALDYMNIAIESKVDGIIVKPDGTYNMRKTINRAMDAGIPVVTVLQDESDSSRISYVGLNSYQLGMTLGEQVLKCLKPGTDSILVLLSETDAGKELVLKQLKSTVQESGMADHANIRSTTMHARNTFETEEFIRDIFISEENRPDILVCMNEADSVRAYQAMIDYNCVGDVEIIGYYQSETIVQAVQKQIIPMAIALDTEEIGSFCIEALEEYAHMGYASNYYSVDMHIITPDNVEEYLPEEDKGGKR